MFGDDGVADRGGDDEEERTHKSSHQSLTLKMGLMQRKVKLIGVRAVCLRCTIPLLSNFFRFSFPTIVML